MRWRGAAAIGLGCGLAATPIAGAPAPAAARGLALAAIAGGIALAACAPRGRPGPRTPGSAAAAWLALVCLVAAALGVAIAGARLAAIDSGALRGQPGTRLRVSGFVAAVPRRAGGKVDVRLQTPAGRLLVEAPEPVADLDVGAGVTATGTLRAPSDFERDYLERMGIAGVLATRSIAIGDARRGGLTGVLDRVRVRAQDALSSGTPEPAAALLRGFVLGQDDRIDSETADEFKRSGLAHLLAVSGQNVVLLAVLAAAVLALLGVGIRARLVCVLALIAVYVCVTGAGPSIQRAGAMGAAAVVAALAERPPSRWYALGIAACATLVLDPRAVGDVGWQLSFAAVVGILVLARPLGRVLRGSAPGRVRSALAEAAALTIAATLATAPLMSFHFATVSLVALPANLLAVVAEAPVMWLGMIAAALGQVPGLPIEPLTWLAGHLAAYIAAVAETFAAPGWAQVELGIPGGGALAAVYAALAVTLLVGLRLAARRRGLGGPRRLLAAGAGVVAVAAALAALAAAAPGGPPPPANGLRVSVLDVGQGDAILLDPPDGAPVLVDAGAPDAGVATELAQRDTGRLAALIVTHRDSDHAGGAPAVLADPGARHLVAAWPGRDVVGAARGAGTPVDRVTAGSGLRSGALRLRVLWPPPHTATGGVVNAGSLVLLARYHRFRMLLCGDAEAELAPVHPGAIDVLKVAHHGSEDAGLPLLLAETEPRLAVISVGADNPYGHPTAATLAELAEARVPVLRTDLDGEVTITAGGGGWEVDAPVPTAGRR